MKTHELAKALTQLARVLKAGPNTEFEDLTNLSTYLSSKKTPRASRPQSVSSDISEKGAGLVLLTKMANNNKKDLIELANELQIPLEVRPADAVRDVLGKMLKYINENPDVQKRLTSPVANDSPAANSTLARALSILMTQT